MKIIDPIFGWHFLLMHRGSLPEPQTKFLQTLSHWKQTLSVSATL